MMPERKMEILQLVDAYNRARERGYIPPFVARNLGMIDQVAKDIGVPTAELNDFLKIIEPDLAQEYLFG